MSCSVIRPSWNISRGIDFWCIPTCQSDTYCQRNKKKKTKKKNEIEQKKKALNQHHVKSTSENSK